MHKNRKKMRKILSLCLAVVFVLGTVQPSGSYAMSADLESEILSADLEGEFVSEEQETVKPDSDQGAAVPANVLISDNTEIGRAHV